MKRFVLGAALCCVAAFSPARAGEAADALSQCLASSVTPEDRRDLVRWIFAAITAHPDLHDLSSIETAGRDQADGAAADVFERLIAHDCPAQARAAILAEGMEGYKAAFETLGAVAMEDVVTHKEVQSSLERLGRHIDNQRVMQALLSE